VDTLAALRFYAAQPGPYVIKIAGTILGNEMVRVTRTSPCSASARARGSWALASGGQHHRVRLIHNVVIRNITFEKAVAPQRRRLRDPGRDQRVVDHCRFLSDRTHDIDFYDGLLDITNGADFVTASWNQFTEHFKTSLVGSSDTSTRTPGT
jgi:pectate lyase